ncbi:MAG TPA: trehalase family glycosidase [bacterium]|nr:trehalase family glycosidase [bacterium]HPN44474.1 trehalase family glycosidase [bacterium]
MRNCIKVVNVMLFTFCGTLLGQPYFDTYVPNKYVKENIFLNKVADTSATPVFVEIKGKIPQPIWPARQDIIDLYWRTWEIAFANIRLGNNNNGFIRPYIDPAFNDNIFTEDCGYMVLFCRYAYRAFNFQQTLDNFYAKQHKDGFICREIRGSNGNDAFQRFDPSSAGINIFPWAEWEYFTNIGDLERLRNIFPVLLANYQWYSTYRTWQDGSYFSSGWGCGMDNQPRLPAGFNPAFSHGHMSWIDVTLQQIVAGKILIQMAEVLERSQDVQDIKAAVLDLTELVNTKMWNPQQVMYYDVFRDGSQSHVKTIGAFWALLADVVPQRELPRFIAHLSDTTEFNRPHRIPSLSADNLSYNPVDGGYWRGAVWAMTNYSVLRGLTKVHQDSLAFAIARNHVENVVKIYKDTGIIWENYSPEKLTGSGRRNFVGEGGLSGTAIFLEYILGIRADVPNNTLTWDVRLLDDHGIKQYPFGVSGLVDLHCQKRKQATVEPVINVTANVPFTLHVIWQEGSKIIEIKPDKI